MLGDVRKIKLNLKLLKPISDLKVVEKTFHSFVYKNINNNKFFITKNFVAVVKKKLLSKKQ